MYFIYALADPRTDDIAYVGITDNPYRRFKQHISYDQRQGYKNEWIRQLQNEMLVPSLKILETVETEDIARKRENYWIQHYKAQKIALTNTRLFRKEPGTERGVKTFLPGTASTLAKASSIADQLRQDILEGKYGRQGILPPRVQLAEQFQVTKDVINQVLYQLLIEGVLSTQGRSNLVVNRTEPK